MRVLGVLGMVGFLRLPMRRFGAGSSMCTSAEGVADSASKLIACRPLLARRANLSPRPAGVVGLVTEVHPPQLFARCGARG